MRRRHAADPDAAIAPTTLETGPSVRQHRRIAVRVWLSAARAGCLALVVIGGAIAAVALPGSAASAASRALKPAPGSNWTSQPAPSGLVGSAAGLRAVACPTQKRCWAVGSYVPDGSQPVALVERWNGSRWSVQPPPGPEVSGLSELNGITCPSPTDCVAVGEATPSGAVGRTLIERWNGSGWKVQPTQDVLDGYDFVLRAVACTSPGACVAVGYFSGQDAGKPHPLVETLGAGGWSQRTMPLPRGSRGASLESVSCPKPGVCEIVGDYLTGTRLAPVTHSFAARLAGRRLLRQQLRHGVAAAGSSLSGVSCTAVRHCQTFGVERATPVALSWNGQKWRLHRGSALAGFSAWLEGGIACTSAKNCSAVGDYTTLAGATRSVLERYNGHRWRGLPPAPAPGASGLALRGIGCTPAGDCAAVGAKIGGLGTSTLAERRHDRHWSFQRTPALVFTYPSSLNGVSCPSNGPCMAIGALNRSSPVSEVELGGGSSWTVDWTFPLRTASLVGVSCVSPAACLVVGDGATGAVAAAWDGSGWAASTPAPVAGAEQVVIRAVSCPAADDCLAVGDSVTDTVSAPLVESWNGSAWAVVPTPSVGIGGGSLSGISCATTTACTAVGTLGAGSGTTLAETWDGTSWSIVPTPALRGGGGGLSAVACPAAQDCIAVGSVGGGAGSMEPLAEIWNGSWWSIVPTPSPAGAGSLSDVSCTAATACTAVGTQGSSSARTLAEAWNGSRWSVQHTPSADDGTGLLSGVSCPAAGSCTAVGESVAMPTQTQLILTEG
jgi:hypothetical protein